MAIRSLGQLPGVPISRCSTKLLALTSLIGDFRQKHCPLDFSTGDPIFPSTNAFSGRSTSQRFVGE